MNRYYAFLDNGTVAFFGTFSSITEAMDNEPSTTLWTFSEVALEDMLNTANAAKLAQEPQL